MKTRHLGFRIIKFLKLDDWLPLTIDRKVPIVQQNNCPSDRTALRTLCTLVGVQGTQKIRIGCCPSCGYTGYIDRPTKKWINQFYIKNWDGAETVNLDREIKKQRKQFDLIDPKKERIARVEKIVQFFRPIGYNPARSVLEIGSGYGMGLKYLERAGFTRVMGIENSYHRAEIARRAYGLTVLSSAFEEPSTQLVLEKNKPFGLIFSHHVMEHVYDPAEIVALSSGLQEEGDYLAVCVPNTVGEPSMGTLLFFPHLHSFTEESLTRLFHAHDYEVVESSVTHQELYVFAKKVKPNTLHSIERKESVVDHFGHTLARFIKTLGLDKQYWTSSRILWWYRGIGTNISGQAPFASVVPERMYVSIISQFIRWMRRCPSALQSCLITDLNKRDTSPDDSPIEIQFDGNVTLMHKR